MRGELASDAVHDTSVVENDQVPFSPTVGVNVLSSPYTLLETVNQLPDLFDVINDGDGPRFRVLSGKLEDTTPVNLKERPVGVERVAPNHL